MNTNTNNRSLIIVILLGILVCAGVLYWFRYNKPDQSVVTQTRQKDTLRVQAGWLLNGEFAGICSAIINGLYDNQNLNVELIPGGPSGGAFIVATTAIAQDPTLDIAVDGDIVPLLKGVTQKDEPTRMKAKAFAAFWNESPFGFIVREDSGINSLKDLGGRKPNGKKYKIGVSADFVLQDALARYSGVKTSELEFVTVGFDATPLLTKQVDALAAFWVTQAYEVEKAGIKYRFLNISELPGFSQPSMVAIATDKTLAEKHDQLRRWIKATQEGISFVKNNPHEAANQILDKRCGGSGFNVVQEEWLIRKSLPLYDMPISTQLNLNQIKTFVESFYRAGQIPFVPDSNLYIDTTLVQ